MKISLKTTQLKDEPKTMGDIKKIIKYALLELDITLVIEEYSDFSQVQTLALNQAIIETILKEQSW